MGSEEKTIVEINGIKMEVDMRHATRVDTLRVGTKVKVLIKGGYGEPQVKSGVVVGFEDFQTMPTIIVAYLDISYNESKLLFAYINENSNEKFDIVVSTDDELPVEKADVLSRIDREIAKKKEEIEDIERKRDYFLKNFDAYFERFGHQA